MKLVKSEKFNTNNAWGFGGETGKHDTYENGFAHRHGTLSYRHQPSEKFNRYFAPDGSKVSKAEFNKAKTGIRP